MNDTSSNNSESTSYAGLICYAPAAALLALALFIYRDFGASWDERILSRYGEMIVDYYFSFGADKSYLELSKLKWYGPMVSSVAALLYAGDYAVKYETRHLVGALMGALAVAGGGRLGKQLGGPAAGLFTAVALALYPAFFGHMFINLNDAPFAALFIWTMAFLPPVFAPGPASYRHAAAAGFLMGLAAASRPAGLLPLMAMACGAAVFWLWRGGGETRWRGALARLAAMFLPAVAILFALWPMAHEGLWSAISGIGASLNFFVAYPTLFMGKVYLSNHLPAGYLAVYLLITTPPTLLALSAAAAPWAAERLTGPYNERQAGVFLVLLWLIAPVAGFAVTRPNVYDGIRHFLFVLPAVAALAGCGAAWIYGHLLRRAGRPAAAALMAAVILAPSVELARMHPYQYAYFNFLVGGTQGAGGQFETEYWTTSYKEGVEWIAQNAGRPAGGKIKVLVAAGSLNAQCATVYAPSWMEIVITEQAFGKLVPPGEVSGGDIPPGFDYYLATYRYGLSGAFPQAEAVHTVGREGAVFTVVKRPRRGLTTPPGRPPGG